jgi:hypothetical protein
MKKLTNSEIESIKGSLMQTESWSSLKRIFNKLDKLKTCDHLGHDESNIFLGQSRAQNDGDYVMDFECAICAKKFRTLNNIINGFISMQEEEDREPEYNYEG